MRIFLKIVMIILKLYIKNKQINLLTIIIIIILLECFPFIITLQNLVIICNSLALIQIIIILSYFNVLLDFLMIKNIKKLLLQQLLGKNK
jgi:hypothetical protein